MTNWIKGISIAVIFFSSVGIAYFLFLNQPPESQFDVIMDSAALSQDQTTLTIQMRLINEGDQTNSPDRFYIEVCVDIETQCREFDQTIPPLPSNTTDYGTYTVNMSEQPITVSLRVQGFVQYTDDDGNLVTIETESYQINV